MQVKEFINRNLKVILITLVVVLGILSWYFYMNGGTPAEKADREARALEDRVGKLILLPSGEVPTIATVADPELLKDQAFFANSKKGDKVLIYSKAKRAILYDPDLNKIINVAPLNIETD